MNTDPKDKTNEELARVLDYLGAQFKAGGFYPSYQTLLKEAAHRLLATPAPAGLDATEREKASRERWFDWVKIVSRDYVEKYHDDSQKEFCDLTRARIEGLIMTHAPSPDNISPREMALKVRLDASLADNRRLTREVTLLQEMVTPVEDKEALQNAEAYMESKRTDRWDSSDIMDAWLAGRATAKAAPLPHSEPLDVAALAKELAIETLSIYHEEGYPEGMYDPEERRQHAASCHPSLVPIYAKMYLPLIRSALSRRTSAEGKAS